MAPKDAERIALATEAGRLTLAMRPIFPGARPRGRQALPVRFGDVMGSPEEPEAPARVRVIRGGAADEFVTLDETLTL